MSDTKWIHFSAIEIVQPIGDFYIGAINAKDLVAVSYADIRRIENRDIEDIVGIQRSLSSKRVKEIGQYVTTADATFPTGIILAVESISEEDGKPNIVFNKKDKTLRLRRGQGVAQIIDGQHRIAGLENFNGEFQLNVAIFVDMDLEDKGNVFATINLQQTKVNKSLAYDLYEYARSRSPQKTAHNIAKLFCRESKSPFKDRIKILGNAMGGAYETLTQAAFVDRVLPLISNNPMDDRDKLKRGKSLKKATDKESKKLVFRNLFVDKEDAKIARILWNYFKAIEERWPEAWMCANSGEILARTTGFSALMRFFPDAYKHLSKKPDQVVKKERFAELFNKSKKEDKDFTSENYLPGSSGQTKLYNEFLKYIPDPKKLDIAD